MIPCPRSRLRIWSRETGSAVPSRVSLLISILRLNLVLASGILPDFRGGVHLFIQTAVRHRVSPEFIGPRTMDRLICASLSHTHCWYVQLPYQSSRISRLTQLEYPDLRPYYTLMCLMYTILYIATSNKRFVVHT